MMKANRRLDPRDPSAAPPAARRGGSHGVRDARRTRLLALALVVGLTLAPSPVASQAGTELAASLVGRVLDASTGLPVAEALVTLEAAPAGLLIESRSPSPAVAVRHAVTGGGGHYRFADVPPGRYRLGIERIGYRATLVEVEVRRPVRVSVSVALELEPVALEPVRVDGEPAPLFQRAANRPLEAEEVRVASETARQALFLSPDARMLTYADVMDGVTLGEGDVFRALQRFPGVGTRDDYTAELWTRGAPWTHTRVTFDGVPLFNPVHAVGVLSAITPEVLGAVFFHPGARPASLAEGAAGAVDLRSRPGGGSGEVRGVADVSMASAKVALDQSVRDRGAWVVAARRSHLDVLSGGLGWLGLDSLDLPYVFQDVSGRGDLQLGTRARLEASGLWEEDRLEGDVEGVLERTTARWGNAAGRVTLRVRLAGVEASQTVSSSRFSARTDERLVRTREPAPAWTEPSSDNEIRWLGIAGELAPEGADGPRAWSLGYDVAWSRVRYQGPYPRYYAVKPDTEGSLRYRRELLVGGVWGEARVDVGERLVVNPGVRIEGGDRIMGAPPVRVAPRLAVRYTLSPEQSISLAAGRSWQYAQAIALAGPSIHPAFHASHFWLFADERAPALRSDLVSLGSERWLGGGWLVSATVFVRRAAGVMVASPDTAEVVRRRFSVLGENRARGVEAGVRRIGARWSVSLGYTWGVSDMDAAGETYPSPADRRHITHASVGARLSPALRLSAAWTAMSGAPFTRAYAITRADCDDFGFGCGSPEGWRVEEANAERTPAYGSLDVSLHATRAVGAVQASAYLQVRNVLGRDNASTYSGSRPISRDGAFEDRFEAGLPRVPLLGVRVTF